MKEIILLIVLFNFGTTFAQSKKEQLQILTFRLDSIKSIETIEKQNFENRINELELSINSKNQIMSDYSNLITINKKKLSIDIEQNKQLDKEISDFHDQLTSKNDSISKIIDELPIRLLQSSLINISNEKLIKLMNVHDEDLGEEFINTTSPEIKPLYEIIGKQLFELKSEMYCMVVLGVSNPNTYHASAGTNFIGCFKVKENQWSLLNPAMNTSFNPSGGFGIPGWIDKFVLFGDQSLAIILEGGFTNMGQTITHRVIYGLNNLNRVYLIYDGNIDDIEFEINFQKLTNTNHYDLVEIKKSHGKKVKTRIYKFNENTFKYE
jgi:hypothetical protein